MNFQQAVLIYNPVSGRKRDARDKGILDARDALKRSAESVRVEGTKARGDATRIASEAVAAGCDLVVACGGDGTINEVIGGMADSGVPLLALPADQSMPRSRAVTWTRMVAPYPSSSRTKTRARWGSDTRTAGTTLPTESIWLVTIVDRA